ncbi:MAG: histidine--tRNA ligase [Treponema sp.]|jgi:histidyl-tRNA synthetase|nr:histidine--tRNA ligase [Treponema sp.]
MIEPRVLKGFRDFLPAQETARRLLVEKIEASFRSFGFVPIDTPALEYAEILLGKGGGETERQIYRFTDHGGRDVALRFDLTVPFARFVAERRGELTFPFKRYHIAKVWRGENTQKGRYREFTQCDFDIVGSDCAAADFEILLMMKKTLEAVGAGEITIRINHRGLFNRFLEKTGVNGKQAEVLRQVDKLSKIGEDGVRAALAELLDDEKARRILEFSGCGNGRSFEETLAVLSGAAGPGPDTERLQSIRRFMNDAGCAESFVLDPSITRGLDYYTGVVYETFLNKLPGIGSVCSGGRYDNLTGLYSKETIPGVGSSIGLDRLQAALEELGAVSEAEGAAAAIICRDGEEAGRLQALAESFRSEGVSCDVFLEPKKTGQQFALAEKKRIAWAIIPGEDGLTLRNIATRENREGLSADQAAAAIKAAKEGRT